MKLKGGVEFILTCLERSRGSKIEGLSRKSVVYVIFALLILGTFFGIFGFFPPMEKAKAAPVFNYVTGSYTDDFAGSTGIASSSQAGVNAGAVQLKNSGGTYTAPYLTSGYVITQTIIPTSVSAWGTFSYVGTVPANTTVKIQVMDDGNGLFAEWILPGNAAGFATQNLDLSGFYPLAPATSGKIARLSFKILLTTTDTNVTPTIDSIAFTWTPKAAVMPSASDFYNSGWSTFFSNAKQTSKALYGGVPTYPVLRWQSAEFPKSWFPTSTKHPIIYQDNVHFGTSPRQPQAAALNRNTGATIWQKAWTWVMYEGVIDQNGILYNQEYNNDIMYVVDMTTGEIKWTKQFSGGHGNNQVVLVKDGGNTLLVTARNSADTVNAASVLYALYPDGSVKYTKNFTPVTGTVGGISVISVGTDGTLYFGLNSGSTANNQTALFYAINPADGSTKWTYQMGTIPANVPPMIDDQGNIYISQAVMASDTFDPKMVSLDSSGNLRWQRSVDRTLYLGWTETSIGKDGQIVAIKKPRLSANNSVIEVIDPATGNVLHSTAAFYYIGLTTDDNYIYVSHDVDSTYHEAVTQVMDYNLNNKWLITNPYLVVGNQETRKQFQYFSEDERGWLYGNYIKAVYNSGSISEPDSTARMVAIARGQFLRIFQPLPNTSRATRSILQPPLPCNKPMFFLAVPIKCN